MPLSRRTLLLSAFGPCAGAQPLPDSGEARPVLFLAAGAPASPALRRESLGRLKEGEWALLDAAAVRALAAERKPEFLYFARHEYDVAMAGLSAPQREDAIRLRRERWTPTAHSNFPQRLFDLAAARWEGLARAGSPAPLAQLQHLAGLERYAMVSADGMAVAMLEAESRLLAELRAALEVPWIGESREWVRAALAARERWSVVALRATNATKGRLPQSHLSRGVFVPNRPPDRLHPWTWRNGILATCLEEQCDQLSPNVTILFEDSGGLEELLELSTPAQRDRDLTRLLSRSPGQLRQDRLEYLARLSLQQLLLKRSLRDRTHCEDTALREEQRFLADSIARLRPYSRKPGWEADPPATLTRRAAESFRAEASLFADLSARHWPSLRSLLA